MAVLPMNGGSGSKLETIALWNPADYDYTISSGGTKTGTVTAPQDIALWFHVHVNYSSSGYGVITINDTTVLSTTSKGQWNFYYILKRGDSFSYNLSSSATSDYHWNLL